MTATQSKPDIDAHYSLNPEQIAHFRDRGFVKLKNVLSPEALAYYGEEITRQVFELSGHKKPVEERDTYGKAFLQVGNLWNKSELVREFVFSRRLGRIATELLGTEGVRMYHDQALYKEVKGGFTPWHVDQQYWPLATPLTVTAWIPLTEVTADMGPLAFAPRSQHTTECRELAISDASEERIQEMMDRDGVELVQEPFDLGEVSFHYGYTFHRAGGNSTDRPRNVMTIIYMDRDMRIREPENENQQRDWDVWCPGVKVGDICDSEMNPILYEKSMG